MSAMAMARVHPTSTAATKEKQVRFPPTSHGGYFKDDSEYEDIEDSDSEASYHSEGDEIAEYWDPYLYQLQQQAPRPKKIVCLRYVPDRPPFYGDEYHGAITREETARLLGKVEGSYIVRKGLSQSGTYSLSFIFGGNVRHYRLHYENGEHFVGETTFDNIEDLVADGLITLYMEDNNVEEYLRNAQETKRQSIIEEKREDHPPPLPPRNPSTLRSNSNNVGLSTISEEPSHQNYINTSITGNDKEVTSRQDSSLYNYHYEKPHNFKIHTFYNVPWCDFCRNFIWGLRSQGYKCKDCGYVAHKQCKDCAPSDCTPTKQLVKRVYGVDLTTLVKMHSTKIPIVVRDCIEELEKRGLNIDGLYRIPGKSVEILEIKNQFDREMHADLALYDDPHAIAGALKLYFRELPIPLITFDNYDLVLIAARCATDEETLETIRVILKRLPPSHYNTLKFLMKHLYQVQEHKQWNRMDSKNLAVVFAPSLMRPAANADQLSAMMKLPEQKKITDLLISYYPGLFS